MTTIDKLLTDVATFGFDNLLSKISKRDIRILKNLAVLIHKPDFITENQGKLLIKLLSENLEHLDFLGKDVFASLKNPTWSKNFKKIDQVKKMWISQAENGEKFIIIEFTFSNTFKKMLQSIHAKVEGSLTIINGRQHSVPLTEKNVVLLLDIFKNQNFDISTEILGFYEIIKKWRANEYALEHEIFTTTNKHLIKAVEAELGPIALADRLLLADRKIRYQYQFLPNFEDTSLTHEIANRASARMYVDSKVNTLTEVIASLKQLQRLPLLVVFNGYSEAESQKDLEKLSEALVANEVDAGVGIYFRFENNNHGKQFNQAIADKKYNAKLDTATTIAGIVSGKIPKFFLSSGWKPASVLTFTNNLRHNKTSVYCNSCDLIVYYNDKKPMAMDMR